MCCQKYRTLTCSAQCAVPTLPSPSPILLFLPAALGNRGIKKCNKLYIKAGKVEGNVDEAAAAPLLLPRTGLAACHMKLLYGTYIYIYKHTMTHRMNSTPDMQHIPLRASSVK